MLILFIALYMVFSIAIGLYSSIGVRNSTDYILAGRSIPLYMTITTVFATWFGSESVVGIPPVFINDGLRGTIAEPIGTGFCLIIVGVFYAARLYRMKLVTIGDFYRQRYSRLVELLVSLTICASYLGWMSAQIVALGLVIKLVFNDAISFELAMFIGLSIVMIYTITGGMKSLVIMDFIQMISIVIGLLAVAVLVASRFDGGATGIIATAAANNKFDFWPETNFHDTLEFVATFLTLALGSVPQQDVFQRVMAAKDERTAVLGSTIGGIVYIMFCFVPIFITYGISLMSPGIFEQTLAAGGDQQRILVDYIFNETPVFLQVLFFGALLSAIMSTASGTLLAPSSLFAENILKESLKLTDKGIVLASRIGVLFFGLLADVDIPSFSLAAKGDHIALWQSVYDGVKLFKGQRTFCLTEAGHVAGVVNPATSNKYSHMVSTDILDNHDKWLETATIHNGSWWNSWHKWLSANSEELTKSINYNSMSMIEVAPGSYVKQL